MYEKRSQRILLTIKKSTTTTEIMICNGLLKGNEITSIMHCYCIDSRQKLFHQGNAPARSSTIVIAKSMNWWFQLVRHPPNFQNLFSSDQYLVGKWFYSPKDSIVRTIIFLAHGEQSHYWKGGLGRNV